MQTNDRELSASRDSSVDSEPEDRTEAVKFDPFADSEPEEHTEAVEFDPFADSEPEERTEAVDFDPFADDEDTDATVQHTEPVGNPANAVDSGERSRIEALSTFRKRRGTYRSGASVADGMVQLPFIPPTNPEDAVIEPSAAIEKGVEAPTL